jgi:hypothetical protein
VLKVTVPSITALPSTFKLTSTSKSPVTWVSSEVPLPSVVFPVTNTSPSTCNSFDGLLVPIPTLPLPWATKTVLL